jgi:hypothetical protein
MCVVVDLVIETLASIFAAGRHDRELYLLVMQGIREGILIRGNVDGSDIIISYSYCSLLRSSRNISNHCFACPFHAVLHHLGLLSWR